MDIDFSTDPRILRGVWLGELRDPNTDQLYQTIRLSLTATFLDSKEYRVNGTMQFGDLAPQNLAGVVQAGSKEQFVNGQTTVPRPDFTTFSFSVPSVNVSLGGYYNLSASQTTPVFDGIAYFFDANTRVKDQYLMTLHKAP